MTDGTTRLSVEISDDDDVLLDAHRRLARKATGRPVTKVALIRAIFQEYFNDVDLRDRVVKRLADRRP